MKNFIGIDVSSKKLNINVRSVKETSDYEIPNTIKAIQKFIKTKKINPPNYIIGAESTGRYHLVCQKIFVDQGFEFRLINPIITSKKISLTIRKKKTDISDSCIIVQMLMQGEGRVIAKEEVDINNNLNTKKILMRTRQAVVQHKSSIQILNNDLKHLKNNSLIAKAINLLSELADQMKDCAKEIENHALSQEKVIEEKLIKSLPGFADKLSAIVASETGDFSRFPSAKQFKAYVGIDPKVNQSGESLHYGKITKRGNAHLRHAFYLAANVAKKHDPEIKQFYEKKIKEGKKFRVALCAVSRKLCERVYAVVTRGTPYEIRQVPIN